MSSKQKIHWLISILGGFFLFLDQFLKWQATHNWSEQKLINKYLGWQPFSNQGIAFNLPMPDWLTISLTIPIIILIVYILKKNYQNIQYFFVWVIILAGALSNLIDRIIYNHVIDYLTIFTAIINIADILIVVGLLIYLNNNFSKKLIRTKTKTCL